MGSIKTRRLRTCKFKFLSRSWYSSVLKYPVFSRTLCLQHYNLLSYSLLWFTFQLKDVLKNAGLLKMALVYSTAKSHLRVITSFKNYVNKLKKAVIFYVVQQSLEALLESDKNKHYALYTNSTYFKSSISITDLHQYTCRFSKKTFYRVLNVGFSLRF